MSPPPPCLDTGVVSDVISDTYQISKVLDSALKRLAETTTGRSSSPVWDALDSLPELESLPVQVGLLTLCCQPGFHAKTMEDFITLGSVGQTEDVSKIGSNAVLKVLEGMPLTEFLQLASDAVHSISDSMVADNAKLVLDVTHALETKVIHDIVDREYATAIHNSGPIFGPIFKDHTSYRTIKNNCSRIQPCNMLYNVHS